MECNESVNTLGKEIETPPSPALILNETSVVDTQLANVCEEATNGVVNLGEKNSKCKNPFIHAEAIDAEEKKKPVNPDETGIFAGCNKELPSDKVLEYLMLSFYRVNKGALLSPNPGPKLDCFKGDASSKDVEMPLDDNRIQDREKSCEVVHTPSLDHCVPPVSDTNTSDTNAGYTNAGYTNAGYTNSGDTNSGDTNSGDTNSGDTNAGYTNSGDTNTVDTNSGDTNASYTNAGYTNSGDTNSGDTNSGDTNTVDTNSGDTNTGDIGNNDISIHHQEHHDFIDNDHSYARHVQENEMAAILSATCGKPSQVARLRISCSSWDT